MASFPVNRGAATSPAKPGPNVGGTPNAPLRPIFLYGALMFSKLLAVLLTGDWNNEGWVRARQLPATIKGYSRRVVLKTGVPAVIKGSPEDVVQGYLFYPRHFKDIERIGDFETESYSREVVEVLTSEGQKLHAYVYLWGDDMEDLGDDNWDLRSFEESSKFE